MKIGVDIDNTVNNLAEAVLEVYNADSGDNLEIKDIVDYDISKFVKSQYKENFQVYFSDSRVWNKVRPIIACVDYIKKLTEDRHDIYFVTATCPDMVEKKAQWLSKYFPFINVNFKLVICANKQLLSGLDVLIDDYFGNLIGGEYYCILPMRPWNHEYHDNDKMFPCYNWQAIYNTINFIKDLKENDSSKT